jgi:ABC-type phosphate/phosphonate transport system substrate-binding protein
VIKFNGSRLWPTTITKQTKVIATTELPVLTMSIRRYWITAVTRKIQTTLVTNKKEANDMPRMSDMSKDELDLWSDINNSNNDADINDWADAHNPNNEDYLGDDDIYFEEYHCYE